MELDALRDPQRLAVAAKRLGMVPPAEPAFIRLADGRVLGNPTAATSGDAVRINPLPARKPTSLAPKPIVIKVPWKPAPTDPTVNSATGTGAASSDAATRTG